MFLFKMITCLTFLKFCCSQKVKFTSLLKSSSSFSLGTSLDPSSPGLGIERLSLQSKPAIK